MRRIGVCAKILVRCVATVTLMLPSFIFKPIQAMEMTRLLKLTISHTPTIGFQWQGLISMRRRGIVTVTKSFGIFELKGCR